MIEQLLAVFAALPSTSDLFLGISSTVVALILIFLTIVMFLHLTVLQVIETAAFWGDYLNRYRLRILVCLVIVDATLIPVAWYLVLLYLGLDNDQLREFSRIAGRVGPFALAIAFESIYFYNRRKNN